MDRWHILSTLNYLKRDHELRIVMGKVPELKTTKDKALVINMIQLADLTRQGFINDDISNLMSPRTVITWAQNFIIFKDIFICIFSDMTSCRIFLMFSICISIKSPVFCV